MSRMIFVLWSWTESYPVWKSIDFYLQLTCLRLGLTVGNSFFLPMEMKKTALKGPCRFLKPRSWDSLSILEWVVLFCLTQVFQDLPPPSAPPALGTCTGFHVHHYTGRRDHPQATVCSWPHAVVSASHLPPQRNPGIHSWLRGKRRSTSARQAYIYTTFKNVLSVL